jgi:hypothetical protein
MTISFSVWDMGLAQVLVVREATRCGLRYVRRLFELCGEHFLSRLAQLVVFYAKRPILRRSHIPQHQVILAYMHATTSLVHHNSCLLLSRFQIANSLFLSQTCCIASYLPAALHRRRLCNYPPSNHSSSRSRPDRLLHRPTPAHR